MHSHELPIVEYDESHPVTWHHLIQKFLEKPSERERHLVSKVQQTQMPRLGKGVRVTTTVMAITLSAQTSRVEKQYTHTSAVGHLPSTVRIGIARGQHS